MWGRCFTISSLLREHLDHVVQNRVAVPPTVVDDFVLVGLCAVAHPHVRHLANHLHGRKPSRIASRHCNT